MIRRACSSIWILSGVAVAITAGCAGGDNAVDVVGQVTYAGMPVEIGEVEFVPTDTSVSGTFSAPIERGEYALRGDKALAPGSYRVEVRGFRNQDGSTTAIDFSNPEARYTQYLPSKYNRISQLTANIEASAGGEVRHDINLEK